MAKKIDSWKRKGTYEILAPGNFEHRELGITMANAPNDLIGRTAGVSLSDLTQDKSKQHLKLVFEIVNVNGEKANTKFKKFDVNRGYLRSKIRKGSSKIDYITDLNVDSAKIRIKIMVISTNIIKTGRKKEITQMISTVLTRYENTNFDQFIQLALFGKLGGEIYRKIKRICPIRRVEIRQISVM